MVTMPGDEEPEARVAVPVRADGVRFALTLRRSLESTTSANGVVTRGLLIGGIVGLILAVVVGAALARRLVRRLNGLRESVLRLAHVGPAAEIRPDSVPDEVGDLGRAFALMQERLREQEHARRAFVATASHEMRTPVASLRLMLEFLSEDLEQDDPDIADARHRVRTALAQAERLGDLAEDLLDLSRLDSRIPLRTELVELGELARAVAGEFQARAADAGVALELSDCGGTWVTGDPGGIAQILRVLLDNALRHAPPGSAVTVVALADARGMTAMRVEDAGPGVPAEDRERIFERFERGNGSEAHGGAGLGLAIARELAERMEGALDLAGPGGDGTGAAFVLTLAAAPMPALPTPP
jgi:signal transduction histidine kinase